MNQKTKKREFYFYECLILIAYLSIGFIPNFNAIDRIGPQWLAMSIINIISVIYLLRNYHIFSSRINTHLKSLIIACYGLFIVWAFLSFFYALNKVEVIVNLSRQFNVFFMLSSIALLISKIKNLENFLSYIITIFLAIESIAIINDVVEMINSSGVIDSGLIKGVTANRNITAFSMAIKIPFVLYLLMSLDSPRLKILLSSLLTIVIFNILLIQSRASYLALMLIIIFFLLQLTYIYKETKAKKLRTLSFVFCSLILATFVNQVYFADKGADALSRASTISFSAEDGSVKQRLRYYEDVLTHMRLNPLFGVGLGNWKFKSIDYDKKDIFGYTVPYHAHSDFIQIGAELGVIGFLLYLGVFFLAFLYGYKTLINKTFSKQQRLFISVIVTSLAVYSIDANLNFPIARPQMLVIWALIIAIISNGYFSEDNDKKFKDQLKAGKYFLITLLIFGMGSLFISNKVYDSLKNQFYLLKDFNRGEYKTNLSDVIAMDLNIPNVTVTTIPMVDIKARYLINSKKYDDALDFLLKDKTANPYLFYKESLMSTVFEKQGKIDSAYYYAKQAYNGLPNNHVHVAKFLNLALAKKDLEAIKSAASNLLETHSKTNWQNILTAYVDLVGHGDKELIRITERAVNLFPYDKNIMILKKLANVSSQNISKAEIIAKNALSFFNDKNYKEAARLYIEASNYNPIEYSYLENAATSFYLIEEFGNALLYSGKVIENFNPGTGKSEYIHGISKISIGDKTGCEFIFKSVSFGFEGAKKIYDQNCK